VNPRETRLGRAGAYLSSNVRSLSLTLWEVLRLRVPVLRLQTAEHRCCKGVSSAKIKKTGRMKPFNWSARLPLAESKLTPETRVLAPASTVLQGLLDDAPADQFTLAWLLGHLHKRSFGFIMLLLALVAMLPGISFGCQGLRRPHKVCDVFGRDTKSILDHRFSGC
jgi:Exopolysaccharide synthesis, ExoD